MVLAMSPPIGMVSPTRGRGDWVSAGPRPGPCAAVTIARPTTDNAVTNTLLIGALPLNGPWLAIDPQIIPMFFDQPLFDARHVKVTVRVFLAGIERVRRLDVPHHQHVRAAHEREARSILLALPLLRRPSPRAHQRRPALP